MVFPDSVDLEIVLRRALVAKTELLGNSTARRVARHDRRLHAMEPEFLETETQHDHERFGYIAVSRLGFVNPVTDVGVLERPPLDGVEVDLTGEHALDEHAEAVAGAELTLALRAEHRVENAWASSTTSGWPGSRCGSHLVNQSRLRRRTSCHLAKSPGSRGAAARGGRTGWSRPLNVARLRPPIDVRAIRRRR